MQKLLLSLCLLSSCIIKSFSQDSLNIEYIYSGYVINKDSDTLFGDISVRPSTIHYQVLVTDAFTRKYKLFDAHEVLKYQMGDRTFIGLRDMFLELIYKGKKANLYKYVQPQLNPAMMAFSYGLIAGAIAMLIDWEKIDYYYLKKGKEKNLILILHDKIFQKQFIAESEALRKEYGGKKWKEIKNDSTLISIFKKYNE